MTPPQGGAFFGGVDTALYRPDDNAARRRLGAAQ